MTDSIDQGFEDLHDPYADNRSSSELTPAAMTALSGAALVTALGLAWMLLAGEQISWAGDIRVPEIGRTFSALNGEFSGVEVSTHMWASAKRMLVALLVGGGFGVAVGSAMGRIPLVHGLLTPVTKLVAWASPVLLLPFLTVAYGFDGPQRWLLPALGVFATATWHASTTLRLSAQQDLSATPIVTPDHVVGSLRSGLPIGWALIYISELIGSSQGGLGALTWEARAFIRTDVLLAALIAAIGLAAIFDGGLKAIQWLLSSPQSQSSSRPQDSSASLF